MKKLSVAKDIGIILICGFLAAFGLHTFVNPANFAPSGVDGIAAMAQKLFGINMGYVVLGINVPLLAVAWFFINRKYVIYTAAYIGCYSVMIILMEQFGMPQYFTDNNLWISVFASGIILGFRTALMIRIGGGSGGVDIVATMVRQKRPYLNIETLISIFCYITIAMSFFVYKNVESLIMSVVQMMIFNVAIANTLRSTRNAVEVRIVTRDPEGFKRDILENLKHGATVIRCEGMFTGQERSMIVTLININQLNELIKLARKHPDAFIYYNATSSVWGNFRWKKTDVVR